MKEQKIRKVVVAGGGTAGWLAVAALSKQLGALLDIVLVESEAIGTVGVGESTIPTILSFHKLLGVSEVEFMRATGATFKLGIDFGSWGKLNDRYFHSFGQVGNPTWLGEFHHFWLYARGCGFGGSFEDYCYELKAAKSGKFSATGKPGMNYAYHIDATRYASLLRRHSESRGVRRVEGKIVRVRQDSNSGYISALELDSGEVVEGDLFIDCTGFRALLIEQTLKTGFEDWQHWLPTNSAWVVQTGSVGAAKPYTRASAHDAGWQWQIPLQDRMGNGLVYCDKYLSDDEAKTRFLDNVEGQVLSEPRLLRYRAGRRRKSWVNNCISLGLANGFVEPLESTSIHLVMIDLIRLMQLFPFSGVTESLSSRYNELSQDELEKVRDFVILHYKATSRDDSSFWRRCREMEVPESLEQRISLFRENAHVKRTADELFRVDSWVQVMLGQGVEPESYHYMGGLMSEESLRETLSKLRNSIAAAVEKLPSHQEFIDQYCGVRSD